jgi:DNA-binding MarR family transcriptional regulator
VVLTSNEKVLISYLWRNYNKKLSINELAKQIKVTPKGTHKILKKFENAGLVTKEKIANAVIYKLDFENAEDITKYVLKSQQLLNNYVKVLRKELQSLQKVTKVTIIFGSVLTKGLKANDIDLFVVIKKEKYQELRKKVKEFESISPKKLHLVIQTEKDMRNNLHKQDPVVHKALKEGYILHGHNTLYQLVQDYADR